MHLWLLGLALAAAPDPIVSLQAACAAGQSERALPLFADGADIELTYAPAVPGHSSPLPVESYEGRDHIGAFLRDTLGGCRGELVESAATPDGRAHFRLRWSTTVWREAGVESVELQGDAELRDGRLFRVHLEIDPVSSQALAVGVPGANGGRVRRFFASLDRGDLGALDGVLAPDVLQHSSLPVGPGIAGVRAYYGVFQRAFPDARFEVDDLISQGDRVAARLTIRATHRGEFLGVPATGRPIVLQRIDIFRFEGGRCVEHWDSVDRLGLLQQLGVLAREPRWGPGPAAEGFR